VRPRSLTHLPPIPAVRYEGADILNTRMEVRRTGLHYKALADHVVNTMLGCPHGCPFCFVSDIAAGKQQATLDLYGGLDAHMDWGTYSLLRRLDEDHFVRTARRCAAERAVFPVFSGHNAALYSITSDAWAPIVHDDKARQRELNEYQSAVVRRSIELLRDETDMNVRILTRSVLVRRDFDVLAALGNRCMFGMSLMTLDDRIQRTYEPTASAPVARLRTLRQASDMGICVYVALAPIPPETSEDDLRRLIETVAPLKPLTIFSEPINIRGANIARIRAAAEESGVKLELATFDTRSTTRQYAIKTLHMAEKIAAEFGLADRLHLWPDAELLGSKTALGEQEDPVAFQAWLDRWWWRESEWPGQYPVAHRSGIA
jgi:DNA repair photolyase